MCQVCEASPTVGIPRELNSDDSGALGFARRWSSLLTTVALGHPSLRLSVPPALQSHFLGLRSCARLRHAQCCD